MDGMVGYSFHSPVREDMASSLKPLQAGHFKPHWRAKVAGGLVIRWRLRSRLGSMASPGTGKPMDESESGASLLLPLGEWDHCSGVDGEGDRENLVWKARMVSILAIGIDFSD